MDRKAFTLIELLFAVAIIALLIWLLLPVLFNAQQSTREVQCRFNQRQLITGWLIVLDERGGRIPYTYKSDGEGQKVWQWMGEVIPELEPLDYRDPPDPSAGNICPTIDIQFDRPGYASTFFSYAVNTRWRKGGHAGDNQMKPWDAILSPSSYPWFADAAVHPIASVSADIFGHKPGAAQDWSLGFYHSGEMSVAVFADGHVSDIVRNDLTETDHIGTPIWLLSDN